MGTQPQDIRAETVVLGTMLLDKKAIGQVVEILKPSDFYTKGHGVIFEAICELHKKGMPVDPVTVTEQLKKTGNLEGSGGASYIGELLESSTGLNIKHRARIVREKAIRRELMTISAQARQAAEDETTDIEKVLATSLKQVFAVRRSTRGFERLDSVAARCLERIRKRSNLPKEPGES